MPGLVWVSCFYTVPACEGVLVHRYPLQSLACVGMAGYPSAL